MSRQRAPRHERAIVSAVCLYELTALWTNAPTITYCVHRRPWLAGFILAALAHHFLPPKEGR